MCMCDCLIGNPQLRTAWCVLTQMDLKHIDLDKVEEQGKHLQSLFPIAVPTGEKKYRVTALEFPDREIQVWEQTVCAVFTRGIW